MAEVEAQQPAAPPVVANPFILPQVTPPGELNLKDHDNVGC